MHQGDLLTWIEKRERGKVRGGVAAEEKNVTSKVGPEHQTQPNFRTELEWLRNRCTECGNSLSSSSDGQGLCTTLLDPPEERNGKRKRKVGKEERKEKGQKIEMAGEGEKFKERRLIVQKGQNRKMGQSAEVVKLSNKSKNVSKNQLKRSTDKKKKFKGGRKGGGKGENVRKITAFF